MTRFNLLWMQLFGPFFENTIAGFFLTIFLVFSSLEECGRYLETIKVYENKPAHSIQERMDTDYLSRVSNFYIGHSHCSLSSLTIIFMPSSSNLETQNTCLLELKLYFLCSLPMHLQLSGALTRLMWSLLVLLLG